MTEVVWLGRRAMCTDQHLVEGLLSGLGWEHSEGEWTVPLEHGAVVVVPARFYSPAQVNHFTSLMPWVVLVLTSDEESLFDAGELVHARMAVWAQTPRPGRAVEGVEYFGLGCHRDVAGLVADEVEAQDHRRPIDVQFAGQVTHERREQAMAAAQALPAGVMRQLTGTSGFAQGRPLDEYCSELAVSKIVLCPSGPATPDSFRLYEALEAGCVPIVDGTCPAYGNELGGYWWRLHEDGVPFPIVHDWANELGDTVAAVLADWQTMATRCQAWWVREKRRIRDGITHAVHQVSTGPDYPAQDAITVLVTTSPTSEPRADAMDRIRRVVASVRRYLPDAEVLIAADGVRPQQAHLAGAYRDHLADVVWACAHQWHGVVPVIMPVWFHQAGTTRQVLPLVRTPLVLFLEHDWLLRGPIDFAQLARLITRGYLDVVRLQMDGEANRYPDLMLDTPGPVGLDNGADVVRTAQWSQRPHLASTEYYRRIAAEYFGWNSRTMVEDVMYGAVVNTWLNHGEEGWARHRLALWAPPDGAPRCLHLDGRGDDPKFPMVYAYDGDTPEGAPAPNGPTS